MQASDHSRQLPKLIFDISSLIDHIRDIDRYSGIQRVVAMLISELAEEVDKEQIYLSFVGKRTGKHMCVPYSEVGRDFLVSAIQLRSLFFPSKANCTKFKPLRRYRQKPLKYYFHKLRFDIFALMGKDRPFRRHNYTAAMWRAQRFGKTMASVSKRVSPVGFYSVAKAGDHLILLDSSWLSRHVDAFKGAKKAGMVVHSLVYDLIPIVAPGSTGGAAPGVFNDWLLDTADYTDTYMAISESARQDLQRFLNTYGVSREVSVLPLTQTGIPTVEREIEPGPQRARINREAYPFLYDALKMDENIRCIAFTPYVLCVGTIEARKNNWRLAAAWKLLIDSGRCDIPRLVFAGRKGVLSEQFDDLMRGTGNVYGWASIVEGPSDEELDFLYKNCLFAAMPSVCEGWGLPVGEALSYGKTAVISNSSSLPEVGMDLVEYCDPTSVQSIADAVWRLVSEPERRQALEEKIRGAKLRSWGDVAKDLVAIIASGSASVAARPAPIPSGAVHTIKAGHSNAR